MIGFDPKLRPFCTHVTPFERSGREVSGVVRLGARGAGEGEIGGWSPVAIYIVRSRYSTTSIPRNCVRPAHDSEMMRLRARSHHPDESEFSGVVNAWMDCAVVLTKGRLSWVGHSSKIDLSQEPVCESVMSSGSIWGFLPWSFFVGRRRQIFISYCPVGREEEVLVILAPALGHAERPSRFGCYCSYSCDSGC